MKYNALYFLIKTRFNGSERIHKENKTAMATVTNAAGARERKKSFKTVATE